MDQLPWLGNRELNCLLLFTCNYVVAWDGLRYFIVALPEPSMSLFTINVFLLVSQDFVVALYTEVCVQKHLWAMHTLFASQQSGASEQSFPILFSTMTKPIYKYMC